MASSLAHTRAKRAAEHKARVKASRGNRPGRNPEQRVETVVEQYGWTGTRRHGNTTRYAGSSTGGYTSAWADSPYRRSAVETDARWSGTVSK